MNSSSPYGPDYSLLHAVLVLLGGLGVVAAGVYLLSAIDNLSDRSQIRVSDATTQVAPRSPASRTAPMGRRMLAPGSGSPFVGGGVPAWAGSAPQSVSSETGAPVPQGSYEVDPDFGHAQLGPPSVSSGDGPGAAASTDAGAPSGSSSPGKIPGTAFSAPDLGGASFGRAASGDDGPGWRTEARALARRSRALSNELGRLSRETRRESRYETTRKENGPSGDATTASGVGARSNSAPGTPDDPDQVPLGGAEWLAAAGAAYALNRLRKTGEEESEGDA